MDLAITFRGLCGFVPNSTQSRMTIVLVDARGRRLATDGAVIAPHVPVLVYDVARWRLEYPEPNGFVRSDTPRPDHTVDGRGIIILGGEDLSLDGVPPLEQPLTIDDSFLMKMEEAQQGAGEIKAGCLKADPPTVVAARVRLSAGAFSHDGEAHLADHWRLGQLRRNKLLKPLGPRAWQAALHVRVNGSVAVVAHEMTKRAAEVWRLVWLGEQEAASLAIYNIEFEYVLDPEKPSDDSTVPDREFELYYRLSTATRSADPPLPFVVTLNPGKVARCMSCRFEDHPLA